MAEPLAVCDHTNFRADVNVNCFEDTGRFLAEIKVRCTDCDTPFQFMGVPAGIDWLSPRVSITALVLNAPIQPNKGTLATRASFSMPKKVD